MPREVVVAGATLLMVTGLAGTVVPFLPGTALIWATALGYGLVTGFGAAGVAAMSAITGLLVVGAGAKYVLARRRASGAGAPASTVTAGVLLGIVGFFVVPVIGFALGGLVGVLLAERRRVGEWRRAWRSTGQVVAGFGIGVLVEVGAGIAMIGCWALWVWSQS